MKHYSMEDCTYNFVFEIFHNLISPRPVFLISTLHKDSVNIAPFSYVNACSTIPPTITIAIHKNKDGSDKDTLLNIKDEGKFIVNSIGPNEIDIANKCAIKLERNESEAVKFNIPLEHRANYSIPVIKSSLFNLMCRLLTTVPITNSVITKEYTTLVIAEVTDIYLQDSLLVPNDDSIKINYDMLIGRVGMDNYTKLDKTFNVKNYHR